MPTEIERKFLVTGTSWREGDAISEAISQGYLSNDPTGATVRVRTKGERAYLTIKGPSKGISRAEFEYAIPPEEAREMIQALCRSERVIAKVRHTLEWDGREWVIDVFEGANEGLVLAEVELDSEGDDLALPAWAGEEVSDDPRYYNAALARSPYTSWGGERAIT